MVTKKTTTAKAPAKAKPAKAAPKTKTAAAKKPAAAKKAPVDLAVRPLSAPFTKASLAAHLSDIAAVEVKTVKNVLAALESTVLGALHKKGLGEFTLPGLLKVVTQKIPAKPKRFGKNPFTGKEQWFPAKPASVRVKVRPLKKLKEASK
jgi:nucleoid DNA-binding protein